MIHLNNFSNNGNLVMTAQADCFSVYEHQKDMSVNPYAAETAYFMHEMNMRKRQLLCCLNNSSVRVQAGAMQWTAGSVESQTGVKGVGDFFGKTLKGAVTGESAVKPVYQGWGYLMLEPTYKYIILEDLSSWGGGIVLDDGLFLACDDGIQEKIVARSNLSSAVFGKEGLFNLCLTGQGIIALESPSPREELFEIILDNDTVRIDGNMAVAWSPSLEFTVEKSSKSLLGSAINGEGLVNVYRGSGKILMSPTAGGVYHGSASENRMAVQSGSSPNNNTAAKLLGSIMS